MTYAREGPVYSLSLAIQHHGALVKELGPLENFHYDHMPPTCKIINDLSFSPLGDINLTLLITDILNHLHPFGMQNATVLLHNNDLGLNLNVTRLIVYCKIWQTISVLVYASMEWATWLSFDENDIFKENINLSMRSCFRPVVTAPLFMSSAFKSGTFQQK